MQIQRAVRLMAMQENRDARDRHMSEQQCDADVAPDREVENAVERHTRSHLPVRTDITIPGTPASRSTRARKLPPVPSSSCGAPESRRASHDAPRDRRAGIGRELYVERHGCRLWEPAPAIARL